MKKILLFSFVLLTALINESWAQAERTISGTITSLEEGDGLPGVNVVVKGTTNGTITDFDGNYTLNVPSGAILVFSFIGYTSEEVEVGSRSVIDLAMSSDITQLSEIVVTAQGIKREAKSLGYAIQNVSADEISQKGDPNVLSSLQGKLTGVNIVSGGGGAGGSTNINIRGISSFTGSNQPLIVVDGAIISNATTTTETGVFAAPTPNRLNDIDPETIESINVLKGPAAAVLYGSRASNGVIVITTKSGSNLNGKTEVTVSSSVTFQQAILPDFQNLYGAGSNNDQDGTTSLSWGPAFGTPGFETISYVGRLDTTVAYQAQPDNLKNLYNTGVIVQNSVSLRSGDENGSFILSLANTEQTGVVPNSAYSRYNIAVGGQKKLKNGIQVETRLNYIRTLQVGSPQGNGSSFTGEATRLSRSWDTSLPFQDPVTGLSLYYRDNSLNPLWSAANTTNDTQVDRIFGNFSLGYDITDWLNVKARVTGDTYVDRRDIISQIGAGRAPLGRVENTTIFGSETNLDLIATASKDNLFGERWGGSLLIGMNVNQRNFQDVNLIAESLTIPFFTNASNASVFTSSDEDRTIRRLAGYYASATLDYNDWAFLELQGRIDQSSTLPTDGNSFFYPGASLSFVLSDALNFQNSPVNYLKLRLSAAQVGNDAIPYQLNSFYVPGTFGNNVASITFPFNSIPGFAIGTRIGSASLTPEFTTSYEGGLSAQFLKNRLSADFSYFFNESTDQIIDVSVAPSSGFRTQTTNVGRLTNKGVELSLNGLVVETSDFRWNATVNYTRIRNEATEITDGVDRFNVNGSFFGGVPRPTVEVGQPYGIFVGNALPRNDDGRIIVNGDTGFLDPVDADGIAGDPNPDWLGSIINEFQYKGLSLSVLLETRQGGDVFSFEAADNGDRGNYEFQGNNRQEAFIIDGVIDNGDGTFRENNIQITAEDYYRTQISLATESAIFDGTTYRLREVSLRYAFPKSLIENTPFGSVSVGFAGRNLWLSAPNYPDGDPEGNSSGAGNIQGIRLNGIAPTRNYSFNVKLSF